MVYHSNITWLHSRLKILSIDYCNLFCLKLVTDADILGNCQYFVEFCMIEHILCIENSSDSKRLYEMFNTNSNSVTKTIENGANSTLFQT